MTRIENLLREMMGLDAASIGSTLIERTVRLRMKSRGLKKLEDYWKLLVQSPESTVQSPRLRTQDSGLGTFSGSSELDELIEAVVVTETWFFRDRESFNALVKLAMNWLAESRVWDSGLRTQDSGLLRILSIPCSSGEEPYSLAMALLDAGFPAERLQIDAVDISARTLARARRAIYGKNSFRGSDLGFRDRYFQPNKDGYLLHHSVRGRVRLLQGNLLGENCTLKGGHRTVAALFGVHPLGCFVESEVYDFIFFRNLLIYFDRPTQRKALKKLERLLAPDGLCFVGPAEMPLVIDNGFVSANIPMAFACRKAEALPAARPMRRHTFNKETRNAGGKSASEINSSFPGFLMKTGSPPAPPRKVLPKRRRSSPKSTVQSPESRVPDSGLRTQDSGLSGDLETARHLADEGRLAEAAKICEVHLRERGPSAQAYYLLGLVRDAAGDPQAIDYYRKALYLEPNHYETLLQMALLSEKNGDTANAQILHKRARRVSKQNA